MQASNYQMSWVLSMILMLIFCALFVALIRSDEKKHGINDGNRAEYYRKNRNERKW